MLPVSLAATFWPPHHTSGTQGRASGYTAVACSEISVFPICPCPQARQRLRMWMALLFYHSPAELTRRGRKDPMVRKWLWLGTFPFFLSVPIISCLFANSLQYIVPIAHILGGMIARDYWWWFNANLWNGYRLCTCNLFGYLLVMSREREREHRLRVRNGALLMAEGSDNVWYVSGNGGTWWLGICLLAHSQEPPAGGKQIRRFLIKCSSSCFSLWVCPTVVVWCGLIKIERTARLKKYIIVRDTWCKGR